MVTWTAKAKLNAVMFGLWVAAIIASVMIPTQAYGHYVFNNTAVTQGKWSQFMSPYRSVEYQAVVTASTDGVFSDGNPVNIEVKILNSNITDLTHDYTNVKFMDDEKYTAGLPLKPSPDGGWVAQGTVTFHESEKIWMLLSPEEPKGKSLVIYPNEAAYIKSQDHILKIGSQSDTLALQFNSFAVKVAFIFGTFSILLLAPIFEAIFIRDKKNESNTKQNYSEKKCSSTKN